jgi:hypothetical protein
MTATSNCWRPGRPFRQTGRALILLGPVGDPLGEHQRHRLGVQPTPDERQNPPGHQVQPLHVVDQAHQRGQGRRLGEETEDRHPDQQHLRRVSRTQAERDTQRVLLHRRQSIQLRQQRSAQSLQGRIRELRLGFDTDRAYDLHLHRLPGQMVEQRRLAHAGLTAQHQHPTAPVAHLAQQAVQRLQLPGPPEQLVFRELRHVTSGTSSSRRSFTHPTNSGPAELHGFRHPRPPSPTQRQMTDARRTDRTRQ